MIRYFLIYFETRTENNHPFRSTRETMLVKFENNKVPFEVSKFFQLLSLEINSQKRIYGKNILSLNEFDQQPI